MTNAIKLETILKDSQYKLTQFTQGQLEELESKITSKEQKGKTVYFVPCLIRKKEIKLTPEEIVRQLYLSTLINKYQYPIDRINVESIVNFGREEKRADIIIQDKDNIGSAYIIVELKKPNLKDGKEQLKSYCNATGSPMGVWTNGESISFYHRKDPNYFEDIPNIPNVVSAQIYLHIFVKLFA